MGRISTSSRYIIDITGPDMLSFWDLRRISSALASLVLLDMLGQ